jgi:hypothetical protein
MCLHLPYAVFHALSPLFSRIWRQILSPPCRNLSWSQGIERHPFAEPTLLPHRRELTGRTSAGQLMRRADCALGGAVLNCGSKRSTTCFVYLAKSMVRQLKGLLSYPGFITLMAFFVRLATLCTIWVKTRIPARYFLPYGFELGRVAASIAEGKGFASPIRFVDTGATAWFTPIYPYLAAGVFRIWGIYSEPSKLILEMLNCIFASLTVLPIYFIGEKCFGKKVATGAAWIWVFLPTAMFFPIFWIWDTTLAALFMALIFWATLEIRESQSTWAWAGYGALWATGVLVNPSILSLLPFGEVLGRHASGFHHRPRAVDRPKLSCLRQVHPSALKFRIGVVAGKQSGRDGHLVCHVTPKRRSAGS